MSARLIRPFTQLLGALVAAMAISPVSHAVAREGSIDIELNRLQQVEGACRVIVVFTNLFDVPITSLEVETVLFDPDGRAERFLVLKSQPLAPQKIRVHQYDLAGSSCSSIGSVLINDVVGCEGEGLNPNVCLAAVRLSSREQAKLFLSASDAEPAPAGAATAP